MAKVTIELDNGFGVVTANARTFSTGSTGFYGAGKVVITDDERYQVSVNIVRIGSKPKA